MTDPENQINSGRVPGPINRSYKIPVLSLVLPFLILGSLFSSNSDVRQKQDYDEAMDLYLPYFEEADERRYYEKQDSLMSDFEGLLIDTLPLPDDVIEIIIHELKSFNWNESFKEEDLYSMYHTTVLAEYFPSIFSSGKKFIIVVFSNHTGNYFHAASGKLSLFEFQGDPDCRNLTRRYLAFGNGNEFGLEPLGCELVQIGRNKKYALIVHTSYSGQGHEKETKTVFSEVNNEFKPIFEFTNYEYYNDYPADIEYSEGNTDMRIIQSNKEWFDIELKSEGTEWTYKNPDEVKKYVFNGEEYIEADQDGKSNTN